MRGLRMPDLRTARILLALVLVVELCSLVSRPSDLRQRSVKPMLWATSCIASTGRWWIHLDARYIFRG